MSTNGNGKAPTEPTLQEIEAELLERFAPGGNVTMGGMFAAVVHGAAKSEMALRAAERASAKVLELEEEHRAPCLNVRVLERTVAEHGKQLEELRAKAAG